jgi:hypothetical protein
MHYAVISERVLSSFWLELESDISSIERNPRSHHYDPCGLRRAGRFTSLSGLIIATASHLGVALTPGFDAGSHWDS